MPLEFNRNKVPKLVKHKRKLKYNISQNVSIPIAVRKSIIENDDDTASTMSEVSSNYIPNKVSKKLLSGFHVFHDKETESYTLECSTCCIGWWRQRSRFCAKCETFISFPIYCWLCGILPCFIFLLIFLIMSIMYASGSIGS